MDDDPYVSCPYDRAHRVPRSRLQRHLIRCEERYPPLAICPYNATHRLPHGHMKAHVDTCETRLAMYPEGVPTKPVARLTTPTPIHMKDYIDKDDPDYEMWD